MIYALYDNFDTISTDERIQNVSQVQDLLVIEKETENRLSDTTQQSMQFLEYELSERPDLITNYHSLKDNLMQQAVSIIVAADELMEIMKQIVSYDKKRHEILVECQNWIDKITAINLQMQNADIVKPNFLEDLEAHVTSPTTLKSALLQVGKLQQDYQILEKQLITKRKNLVDKILETIPLVNLEGQASLDGLASNDDHENRLLQKSIFELEHILSQVADLYAQQQDSPKITYFTVDDLSQPENFILLLEELAQQKLDIELLLMLLCGCCVHDVPFNLDLSDAVVTSLIRGMGSLNSSESYFVFFNQIAPVLLNHWHSNHAIARTKIQLMIIGATYTHERLPQQVAWQFSEHQWLLDNTPNWNRLWETILFDTNRPYLISGLSYEDNLAQMQRETEQFFIKENGRYARSGTIKSGRHASMLASHLLPLLEGYFNDIQSLKAEAMAIADEQLETKAQRIIHKVSQILDLFTETYLLDQYENYVDKDGIRDNNPFLREKALKIFFDTATHVKEYGELFVQFITNRINELQQLSRKKLMMEMARYPELVDLANLVIDHIESASQQKDSTLSDPILSIEVARAKIITTILTNPKYGVRLPNLVIELTHFDSDFAKWGYPLFEDILQERDAITSSRYLIEGDAPNQALLISAIPIQIQNMAQKRQAYIVNDITRLEESLLGLGGDITDLQVLSKLGRWKLLEIELNQRIQKIKEQQQSKQSNFEQQLKAVMVKISTLKEQIRTDANITLSLKKEIRGGLGIIEDSVMGAKLFSGIDDFLNDIEYRLAYHSWSIMDVQKSISQLQSDAQGVTSHTKNQFTAKQVLDLLEHKEITSLGFNEKQIASSSIDTRSFLLEQWLKVNTLPSFFRSEMSLNEAETIANLYRCFIQMTSMKKILGVKGNHLWDESVTPYGLYQLLYPKTSVLNTSCVLITLPSEKPKARHRQALQELITNKQWLPNYFVLIFIPGCSPELKKNLEDEYYKQGIIIIDEAVILDLVLAETKGSNPVGKLRALMLNSKSLQEIDIFKINQLVDNQTSIFVGRDTAIERIVTSGENYALYGGRRIGKSSVLNAVRERLEQRSFLVATFSFEGQKICADTVVVLSLARELKLPHVTNLDTFDIAIGEYLNANSSQRIAILLDEIDKYIEHNPKRHLLIERFRSLSERYPTRFRVIVAGFMELYKCMQLRGPYTPTSDPWQRMFRHMPLENLKAENAEAIVREGFIEILGWEFEHRSIPLLVVQRTGGHPAFVQKFCEKLQQLVAKRGDRTVKIHDLQIIFEDQQPEDGFIAFVGKTLEMNLGKVARYVIFSLVLLNKDLKSFRFEQLSEASSIDIPLKILNESIEYLIATSVIRQIQPQLYEFTVPDYPLILSRLGDIKGHLETLEESVKESLEVSNEKLDG